MSDDTPDSLRGRIASFLAPSQDGDASPQARDEEPFVVGREEFREEVDAEKIGDYVAEYQRNPLIRVPIQNFAADVLEPGVSVAADAGDDDVPTVPAESRIPERYHGLPVDDALERWLSESYIDGFSFDADAADLLEEVVKDRRGRRGTAIVEHAYDDPRERDRLMALRPIRIETVTAYTREGKAIALRPDDNPGEFDAVAVRDLGDPTRTKAPTTPAGNTAAIAQFDEIFGSEERDEIPFALDDITVSAYDADTGELFGRPDSATILNRAAALRKKLRHVDQSVINTAFGNVIATVDSQEEEVVRQVRDNLDVNVKDRGERADPETVSATNAPVEITEVDGQVPDVVDIIQQEIEFILTAMPTPLYRVGFAGGINRDITTEQREDYRDEVKRERSRLEADFRSVVEQKAREWLLGDPHADGDLGVDVRLRIRPSQSESPLRDEEFDASEFADFASALKQAAPGGAVAQVLPPHELREMILDLEPEPPAPPESESEVAAPGLPDEADERVQETFDELYGADLATRYAEGDEVETPDGVGVVTDVFESDGTFAGRAVEATSDSPTYVVATENYPPAFGTYSASDLTATTIEADGVNDPTDAAAEAEAAMDTHLAAADTEADELAELGVTDWDYPPSWRKSPTPNRVILLKAWAGMDGSFSGCEREMRGEIARTAPFCAAMKDRVLLTEQWRE